jgi:hypothetical protein
MAVRRRRLPFQNLIPAFGSPWARPREAPSRGAHPTAAAALYFTRETCRLQVQVANDVDLVPRKMRF